MVVIHLKLQLLYLLTRADENCLLSHLATKTKYEQIEYPESPQPHQSTGDYEIDDEVRLWRDAKIGNKKEKERRQQDISKLGIEDCRGEVLLKQPRVFIV